MRRSKALEKSVNDYSKLLIWYHEDLDFPPHILNQAYPLGVILSFFSIFDLAEPLKLVCKAFHFVIGEFSFKLRQEIGISDEECDRIFDFKNGIKHDSCVRFLLKSTNFDRFRTYRHYSFEYDAFSYFCKWGLMFGVKELLPQCDPRESGHRSFLQACEFGQVEVVDLLLSDGRIDPTFMNTYCLRLCARTGKSKVIERLLQEPNVDPSEFSNLAIEAAAKGGHSSAFRVLSQHPKVKITHRCLLYASETGSASIVNQILSSKSHTIDSNNSEPVLRAAELGHVDVLQAFLDHKQIDPGANENEIIVWATFHGNVSCVRRLMKDRRVDPSDNNNYAYKFAIARGRTRLARLLLTDKRVRKAIKAEKEAQERAEREARREARRKEERRLQRARDIAKLRMENERREREEREELEQSRELKIRLSVRNTVPSLENKNGKQDRDGPRLSIRGRERSSAGSKRKLKKLVVRPGAGRGLRSLGMGFGLKKRKNRISNNSDEPPPKIRMSKMRKLSSMEMISRNNKFSQRRIKKKRRKARKNGNGRKRKKLKRLKKIPKKGSEKKLKKVGGRTGAGTHYHRPRHLSVAIIQKKTNINSGNLHRPKRADSLLSVPARPRCRSFRNRSRNRRKSFVKSTSSIHPIPWNDGLMNENETPKSPLAIMEMMRRTFQKKTFAKKTTKLPKLSVSSEVRRRNQFSGWMWK